MSPHTLALDRSGPSLSRFNCLWSQPSGLPPSQPHVESSGHIIRLSARPQHHHRLARQLPLLHSTIASTLPSYWASHSLDSLLPHTFASSDPRRPCLSHTLFVASKPPSSRFYRNIQFLHSLPLCLTASLCWDQRSPAQDAQPVP